MSQKDRTVRSLIALEQSASTARVLNLVAARRNQSVDPELIAKPFFENRVLNSSLIVKHRIRPHEREMFAKPQGSATKIMAPMDGSDLKLGARFLMLGQRDFDACAEALFGDALKPGQHDRMVLDLMDELPSLDPFLLREQLKRNGFEPARGYFAISDADIERMYAFVRAEVMALVTLSSTEGAPNGAGGLAAGREAALQRAGQRVRPAAGDPAAQRQGLRRRRFRLAGLPLLQMGPGGAHAQLEEVLKEVSTVQPMGPRSPESSAYLPKARKRLEAAINLTVAGVNKMLAVYDRAYCSLTQDGKPTAFRDFLLSAPDMFMALGEQSGSVQHIMSFWRYRFPGVAG
jgi:hypothetical protein